MGKSNNLHHTFKKKYQRELKLNNFFRDDEIKILNNINNCLIKKIIIYFSDFSKKNIRLVSHSTKTEFCNINNIKNFKCINLIEILSETDKFFIIFSEDFLSVVIDLLFGGNGNHINKTNKIEYITSAELFANKKIITFITQSFSEIYEKFFSRKIKFINTKVFMDFESLNHNFNELFLNTSFNFNINNTQIFFSILASLSIIKKLNRKVIKSIDKKQDTHTDKTTFNKFSLLDIHNITLNVIVKMIDISISHNELNNLSEGNVVLIENPNKIIAFIEDKPIFFGNYKRFNEQSIIFIDAFIDKKLQWNKNKENTLMNSLEQSSDNTLVLDTSKKTSKHKNINENKLYVSEEKENNKTILLDTVVNISVELGRSKIKIKDFLSFSIGSMLVLDKLIKEPLDVFINGHLIASGEIVFLEKKYGLHITSINNISKKNTNISI